MPILPEKGAFLGLLDQRSKHEIRCNSANRNLELNHYPSSLFGAGCDAASGGICFLSLHACELSCMLTGSTSTMGPSREPPTAGSTWRPYEEHSCPNISYLA